MWNMLISKKLKESTWTIKKGEEGHQTLTLKELKPANIWTITKLGINLYNTSYISSSTITSISTK